LCSEARYSLAGNLSVYDAPAATIRPKTGDGYAYALTNFNFMANAAVLSQEAVDDMSTNFCTVRRGIFTQFRQNR
jgi:hypothetical protein